MVKVKKKAKKPHLFVLEILIFLVVLVIFAVVFEKYYFPGSLTNIATSLSEDLSANFNGNGNANPAYYNEAVIFSKNMASDNTIWSKIFTDYPLADAGKSYADSAIVQGTMVNADKILQNIFPFDRAVDFKPTRAINWQEDPYQDKYWRSKFYGLTEFGDLNFAFDKTQDLKYLKKEQELLVSFLTIGINQPHSWDDYNSVSYRTMYLTKSWWLLRQNNLLDSTLSASLLKALVRHGDFMADPNNFNFKNIHGLNEATALLVLVNNFPELDPTHNWMNLSQQRLSASVDALADSEGVIAGNALNNQFNSLDQLWGIKNYLILQKLPVPENLAKVFDSIANYSSMILQPNLELPPLGEALARSIKLSPSYKQIAASNQQLLYVLSSGSQGVQPKTTNLSLENAGQTIMRSGWGDASSFAKQTQLIFNYGPAIATLKEKDVSSFVLYANGANLIRDPGIYVNDGKGVSAYFSSPQAHNTVVVDGNNLPASKAIAGSFQESPDFAYQSMSETLEPGVVHRRALSLIAKDYVLIVDQLASASPHQYDQVFHLHNGSQVNIQGLEVSATGANPEQLLTFHQLITDNVTVTNTANQTTPHYSGLCSDQYLQLQSCPEVTFTRKAATAEFVTLLEIGQHQNGFQYSYDSEKQLVTLAVNGKVFTLDIKNQIAKIGEVKVENNTPVTAVRNSISGLTNRTGWTYLGSLIGDRKLVFSHDPGINKNILSLTSFENNRLTNITKKVQLNLANLDIGLQYKISNYKNIKNISMYLSNDNWKNSAGINLSNSYKPAYEGEWISTAFAKGNDRKINGEWHIVRADFDWSKIDAIKFEVESLPGTTVTFDLADVFTKPGQAYNAIIITFDDSYSSILPAAEAMHTYNMAGNVGVIGSYVNDNKKGYLSTLDLHKLQDEYGWSMVNHTWYHHDVLAVYAQNDGYNALNTDILKGAEFLIKNNLNSAPNWFVYPHGTVNTKEIELISKYYKFARSTELNPESYPFIDPYKVKTFGVQNDTSIDDVKNAISDAVKYNQTLFLTFHRINSLPTDRPGYHLNKFVEILDYLKAQKANVISLAKFDELNGLSQNKLTIPAPAADQILLNVKVIDNTYRQNLITTLVYLAVIFLFNLVLLFYFKIVKRNLIHSR